MEKTKDEKTRTSIEFVKENMILINSGDYALVAQRTASNSYLIHLLNSKQYDAYLKDKDNYKFPKQPPNPEIAKLFGNSGNPGMWAYVKIEYYDDMIKHMEETLGEFHDKSRIAYQVLYKDFQYKDEILECDFSHTPFNDDDVIIPVWRVKNEYKKQ